MLKYIKTFCRRTVRLYIKLAYRIRDDYIADYLMGKLYKDYKEKKLPLFKIALIHLRGFTVSNWLLMNLDSSNYKSYLSNVQYYRMHPINGRYSYLIDSKMELKNTCAGTEANKYMPEYYCQLTKNGEINKLIDYPYDEEELTAESILQLLRDKGTLAIKPLSGEGGAGFCKAFFNNGRYYLNDEQMSAELLCEKIRQMKDYLVTEYFYPQKELAKYCPYTCNSIRYLIGKLNGEIIPIKCFVKYGTKASGFVDNYSLGGVVCFIDTNGEYFYGNMIDKESGKNLTLDKHPDNGIELNGKIPLWEQLVEAAETVGKTLSNLCYMGIDFVITSDDRIKILEINSLNGLVSLQLEGSIFDTPAGEFYKAHMV